MKKKSDYCILQNPVQLHGAGGWLKQHCKYILVFVHCHDSSKEPYELQFGENNVPSQFRDCQPSLENQQNSMQRGSDLIRFMLAMKLLPICKIWLGRSSPDPLNLFLPVYVPSGCPRPVKVGNKSIPQNNSLLGRVSRTQAAGVASQGLTQAVSFPPQSRPKRPQKQSSQSEPQTRRYGSIGCSYPDHFDFPVSI